MEIARLAESVCCDILCGDITGVGVGFGECYQICEEEITPGNFCQPLCGKLFSGLAYEACKFACDTAYKLCSR